MLEKLFNAEYVKIIVSQITEARKGVFMIYLILFLLCAAIDNIYLRPQGLISNTFFAIYAIGILFSLLIITTKMYNSICDKFDKQKKQKALENHHKEAYEFALNVMPDEELDLIYSTIDSSKKYIKLNKTSHNLNLINNFIKLHVIKANYTLSDSYSLVFKDDFIEYVQNK